MGNILKNKSLINLEFRMYGLVNYQLSGIQKGIQFGHAVVEYGLKYFKDDDYQLWGKRDKTFIILNGGTTNNSTYVDLRGSLNNHLTLLQNNKIKLSTFNEPDLGNQLTAVVFLVDERVFNEEKYPDDNGVDPFEDWTVGIERKELKKILFLRKFLKQFKFA